MQQQFIKLILILTKYYLLWFLILFNFVANAADKTVSIHLNWKTLNNYTKQNVKYPTFITFDDAGFDFQQHKGLPIFFDRLAIQGNTIVKVYLTNERFEQILDPVQDKDLLKQTIDIKSNIVYIKKMPWATFSFIPIRINNDQKLEKLVSADLVVVYENKITYSSLNKKAFVSNSVLASGEWIKIGVNKSGVYVLTKAYLKSLGIKVENIDPRTIKLYGSGSGLLPQLNSASRFDDIPENSIQVTGESDGVLDDSDQILFYGKGQKDLWIYDSLSSHFKHINNIYSDITYYFLTYGGVNGKRIISSSSAGTPTVSVNEFDQLYVYEKDLNNLIRSGRTWLGEEFGRVNSYRFNVNMGSVNISSPLYIRSLVAARSFSPSTFSVSVNSNSVLTHTVSAVIANYESPFASSDGVKTLSTPITDGNINIGYAYNSPNLGSLAWLDYFELQTRNFLVKTTGQLIFRDTKSVGVGKIAQFNVNSNSNIKIWDVTLSTEIKAPQISVNNNNYSYVVSTDTLREFVAFSPQDLYVPLSVVRLSNQNIHGLPSADLIIITHPQFLTEAQILGQFHQSKSNLRVHVLTTDQIYNEFSSGAQDVTAIRDCLRMFYKRATNPNDLPKYVTLFGRASYDYKNRITNNTDYVPTYESVESFDPIGSYNSDDYFGMLDDNEGKWDSNADTKEYLDVAIGRLPAQSNVQAQNMVNKITRYVTNPEFGDWKTKLVFVADDEDYNLHISDAEVVATKAVNKFPDYNIKKIYIDAYNEENTSGGARNTLAQTEIIKAVEQGAMIINYAGHGGEVGWASERILNTDDILGWTNGGKLPVFLTATCEFSRFDDPARTSAGEMVLLNPNGGGIALFTTVRLVFTSANSDLNQKFYDYIGLDSASAFNRKTLGEVMQLTKNAVNPGFDKNTRNFTLLGDPAVYLAYPTHGLKTTKINKETISIIPDTLKAFSKITVEGTVVDNTNSILNNYNGVIYPTVYDKASTYRTIANNPTSQQANFIMQNNVIYRGKASVKNGLFTFSFIVPKDISYEIGYGKISYTADNGLVDAIGNYKNIIVGKTADSIPGDNIGPEIKLYLNDEKFVFGGITNENPILIMKIRDENGINITGRGVGRDISMIINNDNTKNTSLNDYYQAKMDSYQEGEVRFQLKGLSQGKNMLKTAAFDIYNNSSDAMLEFIVANSESMAIQHVLNYPNPFTTNTTFHFDHNKAGEPIMVQVQVFTVSGKLIKTLQTETVTSGNHFDEINWDGRDDFGDNIGKGVYIYKVKVKSNSGKSAEEYQKMVILN